MRRLFAPLMISLAAGALATPALAADHLTGDYVEARTASVFAGACHYGGEATTTGQDAEMAWHVKDGAWRGVSLSGLSAVAVVTSDSNLAETSAARRSAIYVDSRATPIQQKMLAGALMDKYGKALGQVTSVRTLPITFRRTGETFQVSAGSVGGMSVNAMPGHACCTQPNLVWYEPLIPLEGRRVGFTRESRVKDTGLGAEWTHNGQNTAFYGTFSL